MNSELPASVSASSSGPAVVDAHLVERPDRAPAVRDRAGTIALALVNALHVDASSVDGVPMQGTENAEREVS